MLGRAGSQEVVSVRKGVEQSIIPRALARLAFFHHGYYGITDLPGTCTRPVEKQKEMPHRR